MENLSEQGARSLSLNMVTLEHLTAIRKWANFIAVLGFVVVGAVAVGTFVALLLITRGPYLGGVTLQITPLLLLIACFFPMYFLRKFSRYFKQAIIAADESSLELAFKFLRRHYSYMGVVIIMMSLYCVVVAALFIIQFTSH